MFLRSITSVLKRYAQFPVIALLGPRQSGKTTLVRATFPQHTFLTFDKDTTRSFAEDEPERFLEFYENEHGIIIDEFQYVPRLVSYIKMEVDRKKETRIFCFNRFAELSGEPDNKRDPCRKSRASYFVATFFA